MRRHFARTLCEYAEHDPSLLLLVGDIGYGVFEEFRNAFPDRYLNVGIAEQNSIGLMSGLSKEGFFPIFFTIIPFLIYRPFEFIRNDLLINQRNGLLAGVGTGLSYGALGPTHHAVEDLAVCRALPDLKVYSPSSIESMEKITSNIFTNKKGMSYLRIGKREEKLKLVNGPSLSIGVATTNTSEPVKGSKLLIISYGDTFLNILETIPDYIKSNTVTAVAIETINPFPEDSLNEYVIGANKILVVEEQLKGSGVFSALCELLTKRQITREIILVNLGESYIDKVGSSTELGIELRLLGPRLRNIVEGLL